nr:hypothetical protein [uncultured Neisseria sp.]
MRKHLGSLPFIPTAAARMFLDGQPIAQRRQQQRHRNANPGRGFRRPVHRLPVTVRQQPHNRKAAKAVNKKNFNKKETCITSQLGTNPENGQEYGADF